MADKPTPRSRTVTPGDEAAERDARESPASDSSDRERFTPHVWDPETRAILNNTLRSENFAKLQHDLEQDLRARAQANKSTAAAGDGGGTAMANEPTVAPSQGGTFNTGKRPTERASEEKEDPEAKRAKTGEASSQP